MDPKKNPNKGRYSKPPPQPINNPKINPTIQPNPQIPHRPFARGWKYYTGLTIGVFMGTIAANAILTYFFKPSTNSSTQNSENKTFEMRTGYIKDGQKVYDDNKDPYSQINKQLSENQSPK